MAASWLGGKRILVTGGTGTVGRWVVRALLAQDPAVVRIVDMDENGLFEFSQELAGRENVRFLVGDVRDKERMARAIEHIDVVVHCAALKHVETSEYNPFEAVKTNILGVQNLINVAIDEEVDRVLLTSSDKAANPSNTMGATKLVGEKLFVAANYAKGPRRTKFSCVRFGNVLGSRGSIVPLFQRQIAAGGPVTITHSAMTRFVLTQADALGLVLHALERMVGGEIFVPRMRSVRVTDLMRVMVDALAPRHGHKPRDIRVKQIGVKPGEKLYEDLVTAEEVSRTYVLKDLYVVLSPLRETIPKAALAYTRAPQPRPGDLSSHKVPKMSRPQIRALLSREGFL